MTLRSAASDGAAEDKAAARVGRRNAGAVSWCARQKGAPWRKVCANDLTIL